MYILGTICLLIGDTRTYIVFYLLDILLALTMSFAYYSKKIQANKGGKEQ